MIINLPNWKNKIIFWWDYWLNSSVTRRVFDDKIFSNFILNSENIRTPNEKLIIKWNDCRVLFLNWEILTAYKRTPPEVIWDWNSTIDLIIKWITDDIFEIEKILFDNEDLEFCKKISNTTWSNYFWLDVIFDKKISDWTIIEINKSPWIEWISSVDHNFKKIFWKKIFNEIKKQEWLI